MALLNLINMQKIFFHISDVENRKYDFSIGERLEFNILKSNKGYRAVNIIRLDMAEYEKNHKIFRSR